MITILQYLIQWTTRAFPAPLGSARQFVLDKWIALLYYAFEPPGTGVIVTLGEPVKQLAPVNPMPVSANNNTGLD